MGMSSTEMALVETIEGQLQEVIQDLYEISVAVYAYQGLETSDALIHKIKALTTHLADLSRTAPHLPVTIPPEIVEYVESGRNPDIYTREFVELVQKSNEHMKGKTEAFRAFRDVLAEEISSALPALREQVDRVIRETGGGDGGGGGRTEGG
ncbi:MAG: RNA polymerase II mediator complex subunit [Peltula sp. TS41687]|nr:MAG: RNA polymerase II mediator complex subunit [Peltula sp. TS41687]